MKLKPVHYKDIEQLLRDAGLVIDNSAFPNQIHVSSLDYKKIESETRKQVKKANPFITKTRIDYAVGMHLLNLGPSTILGKAIKPGYAIVEPLSKAVTR